MSTIGKRMMIRSVLRNQKRVFHSASISSSSSSSEVSSTLPQQEATSSPRAPIRIEHKRPFSSVAVYHHHDDGRNNYDTVDLDNFWNNVKRNHDTIQGSSPQQQHLTQTSINGKFSNGTVNGSCCYTLNSVQTKPRFPCGSDHHEDEVHDLPPPLAEPKYSVHKRVLPSELTAFSSPRGKQLLVEAFGASTAESYWKLTEHFVNQSDPAFCGVTTLLMCLNAMGVDPNIRWRGGWRYYGSEDVLLDRCCFSAERIRRKGIVLEDFLRLGRCHGLTVDLQRPPPPEDNNYNESLDQLRNDVRSILSNDHSLMVVSFSRLCLGQTGDGHFSPIAAYHEATDRVLVLDVARFKYAPYWVDMQDLFRAMRELDTVTNKPRGWFILSPPFGQKDCLGENRRPIECVPKLGDPAVCPVSDIKVQFCKGNNNQ